MKKAFKVARNRNKSRACRDLTPRGLGVLILVEGAPLGSMTAASPAAAATYPNRGYGAPHDEEEAEARSEEKHALALSGGTIMHLVGTYNI